MKSFLTFILTLFIVSACVTEPQTHVSRINKELNNSTSKNVLVVAHRGDWRHAPENSLKGIENCIAMGVDVVEIDVRKTKDNQLVLMHDGSINRTTIGTGNVSDFTLEELKQFNLKNNQGGKNAELTNQRIPTLEEALLTAKGKVLLNLDKAYGLMKDILPLLQKTGTTDQVILKGGKNAAQVVKDLSFMAGQVCYMPIVSDSQDSVEYRIKEHLEKYDPIGFEIILRKNDRVMEQSDYIKSNGSRIWVNTLWSSLCMGHTDAKSLEDPDANWGWVIEKGATIIQTDNPHELLQYLEKKGLRKF